MTNNIEIAAVGRKAILLSGMVKVRAQVLLNVGTGDGIRALVWGWLGLTWW